MINYPLDKAEQILVYEINYSDLQYDSFFDMEIYLPLFIWGLTGKMDYKIYLYAIGAFLMLTSFLLSFAWLTIFIKTHFKISSGD